MSEQNKPEEKLRIHVRSDGTMEGSAVTDQHGHPIENVKSISWTFDAVDWTPVLTMEVYPSVIDVSGDVRLAGIRIYRSEPITEAYRTLGETYDAVVEAHKSHTNGLPCACKQIDDIIREKLKVLQQRAENRQS